jgi:hypothetical protein
MNRAINGSRAPYVGPTDEAAVEATHLRTHVISVRVNKEELAWVERASESAQLMMGTYLRVAAFGQHRPLISKLNQEGLLLLGESTESVLRIADSLEEMGADKSHYQRELTMLMAEIQRVRQLLVGALAPDATHIAQ